MATLTQLCNKVQQKLGLDSTASSAEETLLIQWLNEAVVDVLLRARVNVNPATLATAAGVADYTLSSNALAVRDLTYTSADGTTTRLTRVTPDDILRFRTATPAVGGTVMYYAFTGSDMFMFYPTPASAGTITVYYVPRPTAMSVSSHDPSNETYGGIPAEYHKALELYALAEAAEYTDHQPSQFGARYKAEYEAKLIEVKRAMRHRGGRSLGAAIVGKRRPLVGSNDRYPRG